MKEAKMIDITPKPVVYREAQASGKIHLRPRTIDMIKKRDLPKGDPIAIGTVAAIQAVKDTPRILPLCHPLKLTSIEVDHQVGEHSVELTVRVKALEQTGVEMEALTGVSAGLLAIWDVVKQFEKDEKGNYPDTRIRNVRVDYKKKEE